MILLAESTISQPMRDALYSLLAHGFRIPVSIASDMAHLATNARCAVQVRGRSSRSDGFPEPYKYFPRHRSTEVHYVSNLVLTSSRHRQPSPRRSRIGCEIVHPRPWMHGTTSPHPPSSHLQVLDTEHGGGHLDRGVASCRIRRYALPTSFAGIILGSS